MNKKSLLGLFTVLIFTVAMHGTAYACNTDSDCVGNAQCYSGTCQIPTGYHNNWCNTDSDCGSGMECSGGDCVGKTGYHNNWCNTDSDCGGEMRCSGGSCSLEKYDY